MKKITLLALLLLGSISTSFGQLSENFDTWPPTGWTIESTSTVQTWEGVDELNGGIVGNGAQVLYDFGQDESLISPVFTVPVGTPNLKFKVALSYFWAVDPNNNYDVTVSISTDGGTAWTQLWSENDLGEFVNWEPYDVSIPLTAYAGSTNAKIKFNYFGDDGAALYIDEVSVSLPPTTAPDCVTQTAPTDAATDVDYTADIDLDWTAATTGPAAESYDVFLDTNANPTTLLGNQTGLTRVVTGLLASTTYYWKVIAKNTAGDATGCSVFSFTTAANPFAPYCGPINFTNNTEPITLVNFAGINNVTSGTLNGTPDHENFISITGNVTAGSAYTITLKGNTDGNFINRFMVFADWNQDGDFDETDEVYTVAQTIANTNGTDAVQATESIQVPPTATVGNTRMRVKKIFGTDFYTDPCLGAAFGQVEDYTLEVAAPSADSPDYVNLQWPPTATIPVLGSVTVFGQVYEAGLTDVAPNIVGQAPGISAWVGYSTTNTNPNTWATWVPATWNAGHNNDNNDEYQANIGANLAPGTYYYATRFQLNSGVFVYGGIDPVTTGNPGNFWDGVTFVSGVLTITPLANDECGGAVALTPGGTFEVNPVTSTNAGAASDALVPTCQTNAANNVWFTVQVPASGSITIETQVSGTGGVTDSVISVYTGTCGGTLTSVGCDDDGGPAGANETMSKLALTGQTPGTTLYISVWRWGGTGSVTGPFTISAYDASLGNNSFDSSNFAYFPNPVKNNLNLSYNKEITSVEVFNLLGQKVSSNSINANEAQIDMSNLSKGAYLVKVTSDNQVKTIKVIKE
ncbi:MAG: T9SS type A sorting domain-containing protein [Flavobacterium sp. JAD_PAG50586_2]|nr:MAG: T9SS type A sorting domain-containing protein [Flavobacterium sp. JAD_PAG50586_2]